MHERLAVNGDLPTWAAGLACALALASLLVLLVVELRRRERGGPLIVATGVIAVVALLAAIARPVRIAARESVIGPKVIVLSDASRSMALPQEGKTPRAEIRLKALVTGRMRPFNLDGRRVHHIGLPWAWGYSGLVTGDVTNDLTPMVADPNVTIHEGKAFMCNLERG